MHFLEDLEEKLNIPLNESVGGFKVIFLLNTVYLEGHHGLITLTDTEISYKLKKGKISVYGFNLEIAKMDKDSSLIKGKILKIKKEAASE